MLSRFECCNCNRGVQEVGKTDIYAINFVNSQQVAKVGKNVRNVVFLRNPTRFQFVNVCDCDDLNIITHGLITAHMAFADDSCADNANLEFI